jgi:sugar phosphate isomerase/epimerase
LAERLRLAADAGFSGVELVLSVEAVRLGPDRVRALAEASRLPILSVHQPLWGLGRWRSLAARLDDAVGYALALDCPIAVVHDPGAHSWREPHAAAWLAALEEGERQCRSTCTRLSVENAVGRAAVDPTMLLGDPASLAAFADERGLGITMDTCHTGTAGLALERTYGTLRPLLTNVHLSDRRERNLPGWDGHLLSMFSHHQMPGSGALPLRALLGRLRDDGYAGPVTVEVNPLAMAVWRPSERAARLRRIERYIRAA